MDNSITTSKYNVVTFFPRVSPRALCDCAAARPSLIRI